MRAWLSRPATQLQVGVVAFTVVVIVALFSSYLGYRQNLRDRQFRNLDRGVCGVLNTIPAGKYPAIDQARIDANCRKVTP